MNIFLPICEQCLHFCGSCVNLQDEHLHSCSVFSELAVCAQCAVCVFSVVAPCQCGFSMFTVQCGATNVVCSVLAACLQCGTSGTSVFAVWHRASVFSVWHHASVLAVWHHASVFSVWHRASVGGLGSRDLSSPVTIIDS